MSTLPASRPPSNPAAHVHSPLFWHDPDEVPEYPDDTDWDAPDPNYPERPPVTEQEADSEARYFGQA